MSGTADTDSTTGGARGGKQDRAANGYRQRIKRLREALGDSAHVVFFGGAGVSTESGIPDFRSKDGLYNQHYDYPPETMLSHSFYRAHTAEFYRFHREKVMRPALAAQPNAAHRALAKLEADGHLTAVVTQNIDGLHQAAGSRNVLELHGSIHRNLCEDCGALYNAEELLVLLDANGPLALPHCTRPRCAGILKPDVVLYEEALDSTVLDAAVEAITSAKVLIVGGTSLAVNPAASLVRLFRGTTLVIINRDETWGDASAALIFRENIAQVLADAVLADAVI
ncbi:MAG: NAD-dependent protein deacylase [Coriobacteriales bacterium]|jgi:NAD-dependent deacetylase|nr:NAD-dependent protein deacylase [Coriobacteriales bacterium]